LQVGTKWRSCSNGSQLLLRITAGITVSAQNLAHRSFVRCAKFVRTANVNRYIGRCSQVDIRGWHLSKSDQVNSRFYLHQAHKLALAIAIAAGPAGANTTI